ncbi:hypothetical protein ACO0LL_05665 [Undibacterium sp. TC4M20W]|uniref:hypothetical protein n=1 Tax=Undibacterium sp. TC4M20W TaxID=3413052 RepID=UPI003BF23AD6
MALPFTIPSISAGGGGPSDAKSSAAIPVSMNMPWISIHNVQSHTKGSSQSADGTSNPSNAGGAGDMGALAGSVGGIPILYIAIAAGAWLMLR